MFKPNRKFRRDYRRLYRKDPLSANTFLLLCELANDHGQVETSDEEIAALLTARFEDPEAYQL
jgi:hypothetical protein